MISEFIYIIRFTANFWQVKREIYTEEICKVNRIFNRISEYGLKLRRESVVLNRML